MVIEDTFGYRFVRISLVLLNCIVLVRLVSIVLQYAPIFELTFVLFFLLIGSNFMAAIIGAIREHRITVLITGSLTLLMFLTLLFTNKESKNINVSLFTFLAIAAQSLIFSEMLKERQIFSQRQNLEIFGNLNTTGSGTGRSNHSPLTAVVVYQPNGTSRGQSGGIFMVDPILGAAERPKDPPPSYFAASCPPPKYEDAIKLASTTVNIPQVLNSSSTTAASEEDNSNQPTNNNNDEQTINNNNNNNDVEQQQQAETTNNVDQSTTTTTTSSSSATSPPPQPQQQQQ